MRLAAAIARCPAARAEPPPPPPRVTSTRGRGARGGPGNRSVKPRSAGPEVQGAIPLRVRRILEGPGFCGSQKGEKGPRGFQPEGVFSSMSMSMSTSQLDSDLARICEADAADIAEGAEGMPDLAHLQSELFRVYGAEEGAAFFASILPDLRAQARRFERWEHGEDKRLRALAERLRKGR